MGTLEEDVMQKRRLATAEDFQLRKAKATKKTIEDVTLPESGLTVRLARPSPMWFMIHGLLPASLAARLSGGSTTIETVDDLRALSSWMVPLLLETFVSPALSLNPGPGQIAPEVLGIADATYVVKWALGETVASDGSGPGDFRP